MKFLETISYENGKYPLLNYHQQRLERVYTHFYPEATVPQLEDFLPNVTLAMQHKVRVIYDLYDAKVEFSQYEKRDIESVKIIHADSIEYSFKYEDRSELQALFDQRGETDDIIIIQDGLVTDSYYANLAFFDGEKWYTPSSYLLNGCRRQSLLDAGTIKEREIRVEDIRSFEKIAFINAMLNLGVSEIPTASVTE